MAGSGNSVPSNDELDLLANSSVIDRLVNSDALTVQGRETPENPSGKPLTTWAGIINGNNLPYKTYPPRKFGAVGDGVTDDTAAMQAWANQGGRLPLPRGVYKVTDTITVKTNSFIVGEASGQGTGASLGLDVEAQKGASIIKVDSDFNPSSEYVIEMVNGYGGDFFVGGGSNFMVRNDRSGGANAGLLKVVSPYDMFLLQDVNLIFGGNLPTLNLDGGGVSGSELGQTVQIKNVVCIGADDSNLSTESVALFNRLNEFQFEGLKVFGSAQSASPFRAGSCIELRSCRGGVLNGCSSAFTQSSGILVTAIGRSTQFISIDGHTYEVCQDASLFCDGVSSDQTINYVREYNPRFESPQNVAAKLYDCTGCRTETTFFPVEINAGSTNCQVYSLEKDIVTNGGGSENLVVEYPNLSDDKYVIKNDLGIHGYLNFYNGSEYRPLRVFNETITLDSGAIPSSGVGYGIGVLQVPIGASHEISDFHRNKELGYSGTSAKTSTIPLDSSYTIPIWTKVAGLNFGSGVVTVTASSGVTLNGVDGGSFTVNQYEAYLITKVDTNAWAVSGYAVS